MTRSDPQRAARRIADCLEPDTMPIRDMASLLDAVAGETTGAAPGRDSRPLSVCVYRARTELEFPYHDPERVAADVADAKRAEPTVYWITLDESRKVSR